MPIIGLGTGSIKNPDIFVQAIKLGYRHFDTASIYENEEFLGEAIKQAI